MKNSIKLLSLVAALGLAYPASSWYAGQRLEKKLAQVEDQDVMFSTLKVVKNDYQRGLFSAKQTITYEIDFSGLKDTQTMSLVDQAQTKDEEASEEEDSEDNTAVEPPAPPKTTLKPLQFTVVHHIQHGPVPGILGLAAGKIKTEFVLDKAVSDEIKRYYGDKPVLDIQTVLNFNGGGTTTISSPAINTTVEKSKAHFDFKGMKLSVEFDEGYNHLAFQFLTDGLQIKNTAATTDHFTLGKISYNGKLARAYPKSRLYLGDNLMTLNEMSLVNKSAPNNDVDFKINDIRITSNTAIKQDMLEAQAKIGVGKVVAKDKEIGSFHYDYSMNRLHAPTISKFYDSLSALYKQGMKAEQVQAMEKDLKSMGIELLKHQPVISLDRLSFANQAGEAKASAKIQIQDFKPEDLDNPMLLVAKIKSEGEFSIVEDLIHDFIEKTQADPQQRSFMTEMFKMQLEQFTTQGYVKRDGKNLNSKFAWSEGKLSINGLAYPPNPMANGQAGSPGAQAK